MDRACVPNRIGGIKLGDQVSEDNLVSSTELIM